MEGDGAHPDRSEEDSGDAKNGWSWCHARGFLSDVHQTDGNIQREDNAVALGWLLGFVCHGRNAR